ncbi:LuxR family transcriptional regulator [Phytoactinopolyspora halotolerans]|uniref:AAA family ATPase n=1 Tax=Phytoactinopolyspora halotolerans TaxID=1981512 RepID=A0A6L9S3E2_9ACTN|nr:LuxR family transcriptional regulator [Phytoactinopolyspora halotolerans]NED99153.1 AAA family ATPase [Phytoactinopolyspora halotolerans]
MSTVSVVWLPTLSGVALRGRVSELAEIDGVLATAVSGRGAAVVIRGELGVGKSALLRHTAESAAHLCVLRSDGVDAEAGLPFGALHQLLRPALDRLDALPAPQAVSLRAAFGLTVAAIPDQRLVAHATLALLSALAAESPVVCLIDDAHELDRASADALIFVARRLREDRVAMIFAAGADRRDFPAGGLSELRLARLDRGVAHELLVGWPEEISTYTRDRIVEESGGNPMVLRELAAALSPRQRLGQLPPEILGLGAVPVRGDVYAVFTAQITRLPVTARVVLGVVASDGRGELAVILHAAEILDTSIDDLAVAEQAGLLGVADGRVTFRHPLIRQAAYHHGAITGRVGVHAALASAYEAFGDRAGAVWHRAAAATGPDEGIAERLERLAESRPVDRRWTLAVTAYQSAAQLSSTVAGRGRRLSAAAGHAAWSGDIRRAAALADDALSMTDDVRLLARLASIRAAAEAERGRLRDAVWSLLQGAALVAEHAPDVSAAMLVVAARYAWTCDYREALGLAKADIAVLRSSEIVRACAAGVRGIAGLAHHDLERGLASLRQLVVVAEGGHTGLPLEVRLQAAEAALLVGADAAARELASRLASTCRARGRADMLPDALNLLAQAQLFLGLHDEARISGEHAADAARGTGNSRVVGQAHATLSRLFAIAGDEERCREMREHALAAGDLAARQWAAASWTLIDLGLGRAEVAMHWDNAGACAHPTVVGTAALPDLVETTARTGDRHAARLPLERMAEFARHSGASWARAVELRCRAMTDDDAAGELYAEAVRLHQQETARPFDRARTELAYGQWLRRNRRRADARTHLRSALGIFDWIGAAPWADRARTELRAAGESRARKPSGAVTSGVNALTTQERQVAQLAAAGLSNQEIASRMSLSPRTVGYHLYKAYPKLGVTKRIELARLDFADSV